MSVAKRGHPKLWSFDEYTPPWLDEDLSKPRLRAHVHHLDSLREQFETNTCYCCPWCYGSICATDEQVGEGDHCLGCDG